MKKALCILVVLSIAVLASTALAQKDKLVKCVLPKGKIVGLVLNTGRFIAAKVGEDVTLTITKINKQVGSKKDPTLPKRDIGFFSFSYDKPGLSCPEHGIDTYEQYAWILGSDQGLVFMDECQK